MNPSPASHAALPSLDRMHCPHYLPPCLSACAPSLPVQLRKDTYNRLTPIQRLQVARHPNRPTFLDIALNISDKVCVLRCSVGCVSVGCVCGWCVCGVCVRCFV